MNLIEELGGYDSLKNAALNYRNSGDVVTARKFEKECLEYRRANNIFEVNDQVVLINKPHSSSSLHRVLAVNAPTTIQVCPINQVTGNDLVILRSMASPYYLRHATDAEFDANHRIENNTDNLSHFTDNCTDIRNHISPLTEVIER